MTCPLCEQSWCDGRVGICKATLKRRTHELPLHPVGHSAIVGGISTDIRLLPPTLVPKPNPVPKPSQDDPLYHEKYAEWRAHECDREAGTAASQQPQQELPGREVDEEVSGDTSKIGWTPQEEKITEQLEQPALIPTPQEEKLSASGWLVGHGLGGLRHDLGELEQPEGLSSPNKMKSKHDHQQQ